MTSVTDAVSSILNNYYASKISTTKTSSSTSTTSTTSTAGTTSTSSNTSSTNTTSKPEVLTDNALQRYLEDTTPEKANAKTIFSKLSIDVGGDGKTITKDQLDTYISKAESGKINLSDSVTKSLKDISKNWTAIADGAQNITYERVSAVGKKNTLTSMVALPTSSTTDYKKMAQDATAEAYSKVVNAALGGLSSKDEKSSGIDALLKNLLSGTTDEEDDSNAELVSALTNIVAMRSKSYTFETEA